MSVEVPKPVRTIAALALCCAILYGCDGTTRPNGRGAEPTPETSSSSPQDPPTGGNGTLTDPSSGSTLVDERCTTCHDRTRVDAADYDAAGWRKTVQRMKGHGLQVSLEDEEAIITYLANRQ